MMGKSIKILLCIPHGIGTSSPPIYSRLRPFFENMAREDFRVDFISNGQIESKNKYFSQIHNSKNYIDNFLAVFRSIPKYDIIVISKSLPYYSWPVYLWAKLFFRKVAIDCDDYESYGYRHGIPLFIFKFLEHLLLKICPHTTASDYLYWLFGGKYIPNSCDTKEFRPLEENLTFELLKKYNITEQDYVFSFVSKIYKNSNLSLLITVFSDLIKEGHKDIYLFVVGDGEGLKYFRDEVEAQGLSEHIIFTGFIPKKEVRLIYSISDVGLIPFCDTPYNRAKSPIKLYEYFSIALPVLTTRVGEGLIKVKEAKNGFFCEPNPESMEKKIKGIVKIPKAKLKKLGQNGRQFLIQKQNYESLARDYKQFLINNINK